MENQSRQVPIKSLWLSSQGDFLGMRCTRMPTVLKPIRRQVVATSFLLLACFRGQCHANKYTLEYHDLTGPGDMVSAVLGSISASNACTDCVASLKVLSVP